jgi:hypothetical protein
MARTGRREAIETQIATGFWRALTTRDSLGCIILGVILFTVGAAAAVPYFGLKLEQVGAIGAMLLGSALVGWGAYLTYLGVLPPQPSETPRINPREYGVTIASPKAGQKVNVPVVIAGGIKKDLPDGIEFWLINCGAEEFWPHDRIYPAGAGRNKGWKIVYTPSVYKDGDGRNLQLYFVGPDGQALIQSYARINKQLAGPAEPWIGLRDLASDMVPAHAPLVVRLAASDE